VRVGFGEVLEGLLAVQTWAAPSGVAGKRSRRLRFQEQPGENLATCGPFVGGGMGVGREDGEVQEGRVGGEATTIREKNGLAERSSLDLQKSFAFLKSCSRQVVHRAADAAHKGRSANRRRRRISPSLKHRGSN
jgi:hypothetical protein